MMKMMLCVVAITLTLFQLSADRPDGADAADPSPGHCSVEPWLIVGQSNIEEGQVAFAFAREMLQNGRPVALLNATQGGTRIADWLRGGKCHARYIQPYNHTTIKGILYWQGESDALNYEGGTWQTYDESFTKLITQYREDFGNVPFVFVTLQRYDRNLSSDAGATPGTPFEEPVEWRTCRDGQLDAIALPQVYAVTTQDITHGEVHPRYAYEEIGRRSARAVLEIPK